MNSNIRTILTGIAEFLLAALIAASVVACIYMDITVHKNIVENSFVEYGQEYGQELLLLLTTVIFTSMAIKRQSGGLWLIAGFFGCLLIRELDAYFDEIIYGAWKYFALVLVVFVLNHGKSALKIRLIAWPTL